MLVQNGYLAGNSLAFNGLNAVACASNSRGRGSWSISNARAFGSQKSWPQGYNSPRALRMPINTGGNIAARFSGAGTMTAGVSAIGEIAATLLGDGGFTANGQMGAAMYATLVGETSLVAVVSALGNMAANLDAGARPSAFDVAQEVWQSQASAYTSAGTMGQRVNSSGSASDPWGVQLEGTFTAADLLRIASAVLAGKVSGAGSGTETFRSIDDARDAVTATVDNDGNRTQIVIDPS